jgi:hypothetical protein
LTQNSLIGPQQDGAWVRNCFRDPQVVTQLELGLLQPNSQLHGARNQAIPSGIILCAGL